MLNTVLRNNATSCVAICYYDIICLVTSTTCTILYWSPTILKFSPPTPDCRNIGHIVFTKHFEQITKCDCWCLFKIYDSFSQHLQKTETSTKIFVYACIAEILSYNHAKCYAVGVSIMEVTMEEVELFEWPSYI